MRVLIQNFIQLRPKMQRLICSFPFCIFCTCFGFALLVWPKHVQNRKTQNNTQLLQFGLIGKIMHRHSHSK